ncbi:hypothetical protein JOE62_001886 [Glutamicibacter nicotianae]|nr:hypothetical protein [Glutamicibacter nicotianae]MBM7768473.1 hypothetical protein [Glutamicibacter nicotianae]
MGEHEFSSDRDGPQIPTNLRFRFFWKLPGHLKGRRWINPLNQAFADIAFRMFDFHSRTHGKVASAVGTQPEWQGLAASQHIPESVSRYVETPSKN